MTGKEFTREMLAGVNLCPFHQLQEFLPQNKLNHIL